jgi:hypothetical protein
MYLCIYLYIYLAADEEEKAVRRVAEVYEDAARRIHLVLESYKELAEKVADELGVVRVGG